MTDNITMNGMHLYMQQIYSQARQRDFLVEAERRALLAEAEAARRGDRMPAAMQARNAVGEALIRLGQRLQSAPLAHDGDCGRAGPFGWPQAPAQ
jgi:hypothetical protein